MTGTLRPSMKSVTPEAAVEIALSDHFPHIGARAPDRPTIFLGKWCPRFGFQGKSGWWFGPRQAARHAGGPVTRRGRSGTTNRMDEPLTPYDAEHIRDALIHDPRVNELDVHLRQVNDTLVVTGNVASEQRRDAITEVVSELAPDVDIRNDVTVTDLSAPSGQEVVS